MIPADYLIYLSAFIAPFVQEDAAVLGAVTALAHPAMDHMADGNLIVSAMLVGLIISDLWKYWLGWAGRTQNWAHKFSEKPGVVQVRAKIVANPGKTLLVARFVPGTRIPAYIAAGFFGVPFGLFALWIVVSALAYTFVAWALIVTVGTVAGEKGQLYLAIGLISTILLFVGYKMIGSKLKQPARADL
jgi:membrane protein DedA with SNARE-associated domain